MSQNRILDNSLFEKMIMGGVANLQTNVKKVNDLNVFPIPDGDTGDNMLLTIQSGLDQLKRFSNRPLSDLADAMAQGMLLGARGNSGVILSQLFNGLSVGFKGLEGASITETCNALGEGVKCAYGAVAHPVEGTILTVAREAVENTRSLITDQMDLEEFFTTFLVEMKKSLAKTPDLLAVLKEAGVIDSGGAGLVYIVEGFCKALGGQMADSISSLSQSINKKAVDYSKFNEDSELTYGYCTELLVQLLRAKTDVENFDVKTIIDFLETIGDSIVAFKTGTAVKLHVHTLYPHKVMEFCQQFGEFLAVKVENMTLQHNEIEEQTAVSAVDEEVAMPKRARTKFATVTVASGEGIISTFLEMGADDVISGGQTNNPSAEDFVKAFDKVNADYVFVLPNNGNVIMAAKQAASIYKDSEIRVIESKSIGQGYSALAMLDYSSEDPDQIQEYMTESMQNTITGLVSVAVRDASLDGVDIKKDSYMGFTDHKMLLCEDDKVKAACELTKALEVKDKEFLIVVYGKGATEEQREEFSSFMASTYPNVEVYEVDGQQDVYDFILIIE